MFPGVPTTPIKAVAPLIFIPLDNLPEVATIEALRKKEITNPS